MRGIALFLSGCLCWSAAFAAAPPMALVGGTVWTGDGAAILNGVVVIEGDTILAVGPMASTPVPEGAQIISTEGMTVLPGLVDLAVQSWRLGHGNPA